MNNLVSIVIPCYNQAQYLEECVQSVVDQTYPNIEIIIVNDGSPDNTSKIASTLHKKYPHIIRVLTQENQGLAEARNNGIKVAKGNYILPLDADDKLYIEMLSQCMKVMLDNNTDVVYVDLQCFGTAHHVAKKKPFSQNDILYENLPPPISLYRKQVWETIKGYKKNMNIGYEDWEFWINAYKHGFKFKYHPQTLVSYRVKEESMVTAAYKKDDYLQAKIVMNHPELYLTIRVEEAMNIIKKAEELSDLYFYSDKNIPDNENEWMVEIGHHIKNNTLKEKEVLNIFGKKVALCNLDILDPTLPLENMYKEMDVDFLLFYASIQYEVPLLLNCDFAWSRSEGIVKAEGNTFPYVPKVKREDPELQIIAAERLSQYQEKQSHIEQKQKQHSKVIHDRLVTVVTRTKDRSIFIPRVFETVIQQTYRPIEWIIVNDNGENIDELIEALKVQYEEQLEGIEIHLINKEESTGMEAASNTGLAHANGYYVRLLDDDDTLDPTCIEKQVHYMENEKLPNERGVICSTTKIFEKIVDEKIIYYKSAPLGLIHTITIAELADYNQFSVHAFLYERDALQDVGNYNESLPVLGDWEFNLRFIMEFDIGVVPEFLVNYHIRPEEKGAFSNTSLPLLERHIAALRNQFLRNERKHPNIALLIAHAPSVRALDRKINNILNKVNMISDRTQLVESQNTSVNSMPNSVTVNAKDNDKEVFSVLHNKIQMDDKSAEILREVALLFEEKGDIRTAQSLMKQAVIQAPEGPFIQKKLTEYIKLSAAELN